MANMAIEQIAQQLHDTVLVSAVIDHRVPVATAQASRSSDRSRFADDALNFREYVRIGEAAVEHRDLVPGREDMFDHVPPDETTNADDKVIHRFSRPPRASGPCTGRPGYQMHIRNRPLPKRGANREIRGWRTISQLSTPGRRWRLVQEPGRRPRGRSPRRRPYRSPPRMAPCPRPRRRPCSR